MTIDETFRELANHNEKALIAYITGGDPAPKYTPQVVESLARGGADIIEIGVPFSDPIADGPTIQAADTRALAAGTTPRTILNIVKKTKRLIETPILLLTYYNILFKWGVRKFLSEASSHGVDGMIIPDLPIEEADEYRDLSRRYGIDTIFLATPSTSVNRLQNILGFTSGFLYLVSVFGVTGTRDRIARLTTETIAKFHAYTDKIVPLAVGFGIAQPDHVKTVVNCGAEGAIVGSALVKIVEKNNENPTQLKKEIEDFTRKLKAATISKN